MSHAQVANDSGAPFTRSRAPTWWIVFGREFHELWIGGRALSLLLIYTLLLGIQTYVFASNSELSLIPPNEMVYETLKGAIAVGLFISLIIGADSISGERERATLEGLLLTPTSRRQIVIGKFLAAASPWPAAFAIAIPYMTVLAQGDEVLRPAILWGAAIGTVLAPAFTALGMFVSFWCNTNKTSLFISLGIYILFLLPAQLPGRAQTGAMGSLLQQVNPMASHAHFLSKILVNHRTVAEFWTWLLAPALLALLIFGLLFLYASPGLRLEAGRARLRWSWARAAGVIACLALFGSSPATALQTAQQPIQVAIDLDYKVVKASDHVLFSTVVTNSGAEPSPPLIVAMNIINLNAKGDVVDPEDWSPQRTQYTEQLPAGGSATLSWRINAILDGDYMVYMVVIPQPAGQEATSHPVASSGIHLTVTPFTRLNPGGVLPYAIGGPIVVLVGILLIYRYRRREIDAGGAR
ncbi:MAG TPA: ABC transporter permease subunit [Gemmatimonadales bacterium]|nr:ABC transporter permease subunit [Gemmatimonadales bacterium]